MVQCVLLLLLVGNEVVSLLGRWTRDSTVAATNAGMGDRLRRANRLSMSPNHPGQLSPYPQRDWKRVQVKMRRLSAAGG